MAFGAAFSNTAAYMKDPLRFLEDLGRRGDFVLVDFIDGQRLHLLSHPDDIEKVLVSSQRSFPKRHKFLDAMKRVVGSGLATSEGDLWRKQRRLIQPAFARERVISYAEELAQSTDRAMASWQPGEERDLYADVMHLLLGSTVRALFSTNVADTARDITKEVAVLMEHFASPLFLFSPWLDRIPIPRTLRFNKARDRIDAVIAEIIAERREKPSDAQDLLAALLAARDTDGSEISPKQIRDEVITLFVGGYEPSAVALGWTLHLLARHPAELDKAAEEARSVLGDRVPTREDLSRFPYLNHVIDEALRLYPPAWSIARSADEDVEIRGNKIPRDGQVWMSQWIVHRDARWFEDPLEFRPKRWEDGLAKKLPRYAYWPYGGGPRLCIGAALAPAQMLAVASLILARWKLEPVNGKEPKPLPSINLRPQGGVWTRLQRR